MKNNALLGKPLSKKRELLRNNYIYIYMKKKILESNIMSMGVLCTIWDIGLSLWSFLVGPIKMKQLIASRPDTF